MSKILYVWKGIYPWDIRAEKICNSFIKNGFEVYLLARWAPGQTEKENYKGINIIRGGFNLSWKYTQPISCNPIWTNAIKRVVRVVKPDLIMPRDIMLAEACGKIGRKFDIPVIMDMAEHYPAAMKGWKKYYEPVLSRLLVHYLKVPEIVEKRAVNLMSGILTVSDELKVRLLNVYNVSEINVEVVHNTPEKSWLQNIKKGPSIPPVIFAYHGHFSQDRNLENLIKGFILAAKVNHNIVLKLAGSGENFEECKKIALHSPVSDKVIFYGKYNFEDLKTFYSETDIAILPFKPNEFINNIIANKLFDYMAAGKPMIVSQAKPMDRIINETQAGIVVDCTTADLIADAILTMENYPLNELSQNGIKAFEEKYNWDQDSSNMLKFISKYM